MRGAADHELGVADGPAMIGNFDPFGAGKILPGDAFRMGDDVLNRAGGDDVSAANARPGAKIDDMVGGPHRVFVVLDDDHRVALVAEPGERFQQAVVVAGVQADRRLVKDVQHAHQPAADLPG